MKKDEILAVLAHGLFTFSDVMFKLFINIYIYNYTKSLISITIYTMIRLIALPLFLFCAAKINEKKNLTFIYAIAFICLICSLSYVLLLSNLFEINPNYVYLSAFLLGGGEGLYYYSSCYIEQFASTGESRARFIGYIGFFSNFLSILAPIFANRTLTHFVLETNAYKFLIVIIIIIYLIIVLISRKFTINSTCKKVDIKNALSLKDKVWANTAKVLIIMNIRDGVDWALMTIIVSDIIGDSVVYSKFQIIFKVISVIGCLLLVKLLRRKYLKKTYLVGVVSNVIGIIFIVFVQNTFGVIMYSLCDIVSNVLYWNSFSMVLGMTFENYRNCLNDKLIGKEFYQAIGRTFSFVLIICSYYIFDSGLYYKIPLLLFAICPLVTYKLHTKNI